MNNSLLIDTLWRDDLKSIRKSKGLTQRDIIEMTGMSSRTLCNIEKGERSFTYDSLLKYLAVLNVQIQLIPLDKKIDCGVIEVDYEEH